jgi:murein DD-endopeptidase MepM/ murein hydrolase activator NlpD
MTPTGAIPPAARAAPTDAAAPLKPSPISDTVIFVAPPDREAQLESRMPATILLAAATTGGIGGALARLGSSLARVEARQIASLDLLEDQYDTRVRGIRGVLTDLGLEQLARSKPVGPATAPAGAIGGPFVPAPPKSDASSFQHQLYRITMSRLQVEQLGRVLGTVPVRKPVTALASTTSGFGVRSDPFTNTPAMHTGLDFRADAGDPVRATAAGTVVTAGWTGGYGQMVEIAHGNGLATRYGHLSSILVKVGDKIKAGQIVGEVGSTGRSTGPHLHYETRVSGDAVDPQRFLRAGIRLGGIN